MDTNKSPEEFTRITKLDALGMALATKRSEAIAGRQSSGIEEEWIGDEEHYAGIDDGNRTETRGAWRTKPPGQAFVKPVASTRSTVFPNITRPYVDAAAARIADMLLPSDDRNFALDRTPIPDLIRMAGGKVKPETMRQMRGVTQDDAQIAQAVQKAVAEAKAIMGEAQQKADRAQERIDDWLVECQYHAEVRKVIEDAARIGTGILKGPIPQMRKAVAWTEQGIVIQEEIKPGSIRVDPWKFFPDPNCGESIHNGSHTWEYDDITEKQVQEMRRLPGYISSQIDAVLDEGPIRATAEVKQEPDSRNEGRAKGKYQAWYFHGFVSQEDMEMAGCKCKEGMDSVPAMITMINNRVVRASMNPLDSGEFPYDMMPWQRRSGMPWGVGVARQGRTPQRIVVASTRSMLDNAGRAGGPQFIFKQGIVHPMIPGDRNVTPWKGWFVGEDADIDDVRKAFSFIEVPMYQKDFEAIIQLGMRMMEDVTGLPMLLQGQQGKAPDTVGGMTILNNNSNAVLRRLARVFDDYVTEPHIRRYYAWLLQYGESDDEKGEFVVNARGSSALVERDLQNQELPNLVQMALNPVFGWDPKKAGAELLKSRRYDPKSFEYDDEEWKKVVEGMGQKPDPRLEVAKLNAESDAKLLQATQAFEAKENESERKNKLIIAAIDERLQSTQLTSEEQNTLAKIKGTLAGTVIETNAQKELSREAMLLNARKTESSQRLDAEKHVTPKAASPKPAVEPVGRAPAGQAFAR